MAAAKSEVLEFIPPKPENFRKADAQFKETSGDLRPTTDAEVFSMGGRDRPEGDLQDKYLPSAPCL